MFNPQIRHQVYNGLLDSERFVRYYSKLADKYRRFHLFTRFAILVSVLVEALTIPLGVNIYIVWAIGVLIICLVIFESVTDYAKKVALLDWVSSEASNSNAQWHMLWLEIEAYRIEEEEALSRQFELLNRFNVIVGRLDISIDDKVNSQSEVVADKVVASKYASKYAS